MVEKGGKSADRFRKRVDERTRNVRAMREAVPIKGLEQFHIIKTLQDAAYEKVAESDFYFYTTGRFASSPEEVLQVDTEVLAEAGMADSHMHWEEVPFMYHPILYSNTRSIAENAFENYTRLQYDYNSHESYVPPDELAEEVKNLLHRSYYLVHNIKELDKAKPSVAMHNELRGNQQVALKQSLDKIGTEKSEAYRETMRRFIPRWMHTPLSYPESEIPPEHDERARELWSGYTVRDADLLIHPDSLADNKAPLHMAFKAAKQLEQEGQTDEGYTLRTHAITSTINAEKDYSEKIPHVREQKFFYWILGSSMAGEFGKTPRIAHFDYAANIYSFTR